MSNNYRIAVVPGDGIGREITPVALAVACAALQATGATLETTEFPFGADLLSGTWDVHPA